MGVYPTRPVIPALTGAGSRLLIDQPAPASQITNNLSVIIEAAGLIEHLVSYDLRRGASRDLAYLRNSATLSGSTVTAASFIGHSEKSRALGVTAKYIGYERNATMAFRLASGPEQSDNFAVTFTDYQPYRKRKATKQDTDQWITEHGRYSENSRDRQNASIAIRKEKKQKQVEFFQDAAAPSECTDRILHEHTANENNRTKAPVFQNHIANNQTANENALTEARLDGHSLEGYGENDPTLLEDSLAKGHYMFSNEQMDHAGLLENCPKPSSFPTEANQFVDFFARINVVKTSAYLIKNKLDVLLRGGSKDDPSYYISICGNAKLGCAKSFKTTEQLLEHEKDCPSDPAYW